MGCNNRDSLNIEDAYKDPIQQCIDKKTGYKTTNLCS